MQTHSLGNILRVVKIDLSQGDFVDENGFFFRSDAGGTVKYCPLNNESDAEAITKTIDGSALFVDPEICRKIFAEGSPILDDIYVGYGV
jgi:hypothetical protein